MRGLVATLAVEGAVDTLCFDAYAEQVLAPRLRPGDVVVLDNLGAHRASRIEEVAEGRGARVLWLAPRGTWLGGLDLPALVLGRRTADGRRRLRRRE